MHILQGMEEIEKGAAAIPSQSEHPIELVAKAYGL